MAVNYLGKVERLKKQQMWHNMYQRCYSNRYHEKSPQYLDCSMCDEWLDDKESFYRWVDENYYHVADEQIDLDKDILIKGNKVYSPDTCTFAPHSINTYFESLTRKPIYLKKSNKWKAEIWIEDRTINLGYYGTEEEAKEVFIRHKEASILAKADLYKEVIPRNLYNAMVNWKIKLADWLD